MIKILHTGDIHLDSPFSQLDPKRAEIRRNELRAAFTSMMTYARCENVDAVLIAGDLFDHDFVTRETMSLIIHEFGKLKCPVIISPGNHDCVSDKSVWKKKIFPENTYIFTEEELSSFDFPDIGLAVYGWAFEKPFMKENPLSGKTVDNTERINVLCAHCDLTSPLSSSCPVSVQKLQDFGADYYALGHIHNPDGTPLPESIAYCGCLEGRSFDELGPKGCLLIEADKIGNHAVIKKTKLRFSKRRYECGALSVDGASTTHEIKEKIADFISEKKYGNDTLLRLTLTGNVDEALVVNISELEMSAPRLFALKINDETSPMWNASTLRSDPTVRGEFYRLLEPALSSEDPHEKRLASAALRYGLAALCGEDVTGDLPSGISEFM